jgi:hypothetical protein
MMVHEEDFSAGLQPLQRQTIGARCGYDLALFWHGLPQPHQTGGTVEAVLKTEGKSFQISTIFK